MYTRIKNQKSGIKLLTNASTRARVLPLATTSAATPAPVSMMPPNSLSTSTASSSNTGSTAGDSPSSTSLSSLSSFSTPAAQLLHHHFVNGQTGGDFSAATVCLDLSSVNNTKLLGNEKQQQQQRQRIPL